MRKIYRNVLETLQLCVLIKNNRKGVLQSRFFPDRCVLECHCLISILPPFYNCAVYHCLLSTPCLRSTTVYCLPCLLSTTVCCLSCLQYCLPLSAIYPACFLQLYAVYHCLLSTPCLRSTTVYCLPLSAVFLFLLLKQFFNIRIIGRGFHPQAKKKVNPSLLF